MIRVALQMLMGERSKFFGIIFGVTFASLLIAQQMSIFCGLMQLTTVHVHEIRGGDIWVMDPDVRSIDDYVPLAETALYRVRSIPGVDWAVPLYRGVSRARLTSKPSDVRERRESISSGRDQTAVLNQVFLLGIDDATLIGMPRAADMVVGDITRIREPNAILLDAYSCQLLWPEEGKMVKKPGDYTRFLERTCELNNSQAVVVGVCKSKPNFQTLPTAYTTFTRAEHLFAPRGPKMMTFILAKAQPGISPRELCGRIAERTGFKALTNDAFAWATINYYLTHTGIPLNFGITVFLGFLVGTAIAGLTFYQFTLESLKQFGVLKAMGMSDRRILGMILLQAMVVGPIGYGLGVGLAAAFGQAFQNDPTMAYFMPWQVLALTGIAVMVICVCSSLLSIRRVLVLEPAVVFRT